ncbi:MAG: metal-binding protein [Pyrinomonadaceae bacterium]|nr:metal-binding protein [Pyrinomonadaceae bacterium]
MPSGKTHDAVTFFFAAPVFAATWKFTESVPNSVLVAVAFLIGGLMFGPDLDTMSKQYVRWGIFKSLWYPYQAFFKHRSRWSHGLVFGTFLRVVYFMGVLTLLSFLGAYVYAAYTGGDLPRLIEFTKAWSGIGEVARANFGEHVFIWLFAGLWLGAASHTLTDMAGTFVKTGKVTDFL